MAHYILANGGRPFQDRDAASIKRDLVAAELGAHTHLNVVSHPEGGYAIEYGRGTTAVDAPSGLDSDLPPSPRESVLREFSTLPSRRTGKPRASSATAAVSDAQNHTQRSMSQTPSQVQDRYPDEFKLNPAVRAFLTEHGLTLLGAALVLMPHRFFALLGLGFPRQSTSGAWALGIVVAGGAVLVLVSLSRFLWFYCANTYVVDRDGVEQIHWYWDKGRLRRRTPRVNFSHLRTADVDQSFMQMLLGVGTLKLAAGGTDTYEVELQRVASPRRLQREFQRRLQRATASLSGGATMSPHLEP